MSSEWWVGVRPKLRFLRVFFELSPLFVIMMSASLSMGKSAFVVIGLEEICHRLSTICRGPGQNI